MISKFEKARKKYHPDNIKFLLIGDSPPSLDSNRFFYFKNVDRGDSLFLETMKVLYPQDSLITKEIRLQKSKFLERFKQDGFYLIDAMDKPIPELLYRDKVESIKQNLPELIEKVKSLVNSQAKIILISKPTYEVCIEPFRKYHFNVINDNMIDSPGSGNQRKFRTKMTNLLKQHGWSNE